MKTTILLVLVLATDHCAAEIVTLTANDSQTNPTRLDVRRHYVARLLSWPRLSDGYGFGQVEIRVGGRTNVILLSSFYQCGSGQSTLTTSPVILAGPATIIIWGGPDVPGFMTWEILPESFPPDKTIVIPEGGGANIAMECSTNLIDWAPASLGVYTNQPANKFFRLRAERVP